MKRRGFLTAILGAVGALLAGKLPAKARTTVAIPDWPDALYIGANEPLMEAGTFGDEGLVQGWQYWSDGGWKFLDDGEIWLDKLEDIARAEALRIDAEIMGDAPQRSCP